MIDAHQHFWRIARGDYAWMDESVAEIRRDEQRYSGRSPVDCAHRLLTRRNIPGDVEVAAVLECSGEAPAARRVRLVVHHGRNVIGDGIQRVPEHQQLDHGDADDECEREPVAANLHQLLAHDGSEA